MVEKLTLKTAKLLLKEFLEETEQKAVVWMVCQQSFLFQPIVEFVTQQALEPAYVEEVTTQKLSSDQKDNGMTDSNSVDDDIFPEVLRLVMDTGQAWLYQGGPSGGYFGRIGSCRSICRQ